MKIRKAVPFSSLEGKLLTKIEQQDEKYGSNRVFFYCSDGSVFLMSHDQDCCEYVDLQDVDGDLQRLVNYRVIVAEERTSSDVPEGGRLKEEFGDSDEQWTFYVLRTNNDSVTLRWYGTSNGYYSISVDFWKIEGAVGEDLE